MAISVPWKAITRLVERVLRERRRQTQQPRTRPRPGGSGETQPDFHGCPTMSYGARGPAGHASGDVVWTWVAYEDDASQGKDRPVLLVGADQGSLLGLPATSQDHDRDAEQERRAGRYWVDIGSGEWDSRGRPSEVRVDRVVRVDPSRIRRAAGRVPRPVFEQVADGVRRHWDK